ncbi:MAG: AraC family ligand binding domain-containing protein [Candidatus Nanohaloarchaea archaeon]|nr:AraC family ligand binding domain-containing protein [Candidatus Nanohaloarchaea archaeon]
MAEETGYDWEDAFDSTCGSLVEGADYDAFSTARARIRERTEPHYHEEMYEVYLVEEGAGELRVSPAGGGEPERYGLEPGMEIVIEPGEVHQALPDGELLVRTVNVPAWEEDDEYVVEEGLF